MSLISFKYTIAYANHRRLKNKPPQPRQLMDVPILIYFIPDPQPRAARRVCGVVQQPSGFYEVCSTLIPSDHRIWTLCAEMRQRLKKMSYTLDNYANQLDDAALRLEQCFTAVELLKAELKR